MKNGDINKSLLKIGFPIFTGMLVNQVQQITDQAFLGNASAAYLSAVGNASNTIWTTVSFLFALGTGTAILVSQKIGEGNKEKAEEILGSTFVYSSVFAVIIFAAWFFFTTDIFRLMGLREPVLGFAATYTRIYTFSVLLSGVTSAANAVFNGNGYTKPMMITSILRAGINAILDWVLIFGHFGFPALGIAGAAIATLVADIVGCAYGVSAAFSKKLPVRLSLAAIKKANLRNYLAVIRIGVPAGLEEFAWNLGNILLIRFLNEVSPLAAGIYTIAVAITMIPGIFFMGIGNAVTTLSGRRTGEGRPGEIKPIVRQGMALCWIASGICLALFGAFPRVFVRIFTGDEGVIAEAAVMLLVSSLTLFPKSANMIYGGGIRGTGDTKWMLLTQIFGTALVLVAAKILIFNFSLAVLGLFVAVFIDELVRGAVNGVYFHAKVKASLAKKA